MGIGLFIEIVGIVTVDENFRIVINDKTDLITTGIHVCSSCHRAVCNGDRHWTILSDSYTYEETYLIRAHQEYPDYTKRVGKFLPKMRHKYISEIHT